MQTSAELAAYYGTLSDADIVATFAAGKQGYTERAWLLINRELEARGLMKDGELDSTILADRLSRSAAFPEAQPTRDPGVDESTAPEAFLSRVSQDKLIQLGRRARVAIPCLVVSSIVAAISSLISTELVWLSSLVLVITAIVFLAWFSLAFDLAQEMQPELFEGLGSGWAIGCWLVPLVNWVFPYVITRRVWKAFGLRHGGSTEPPTGFVVWWACWVSWSITARLGLPIAPLLLVGAGVFAAAVVQATTSLAQKAVASRALTTDVSAAFGGKSGQ